ncbi:hypothetical protein AA0119_g10370 [Alternaria tenuissima]|uniref:Transcription factor domain-containing protein n=1 Tax=Alternaria tenuissima TaxID=119927 RepID=A0ABY0FXF5_9PLEO|nr:hypothetical protein AA0119_g10370 [Alternaria tenuissima]RYO08481.1 hypothetical protein AA0121_g11274 [Alternaria tenuissima]
MPNMRPEQQQHTTNYDMSQHTQDPSGLAKVHDLNLDTFFNTVDLEESDLGVENGLLGKDDPNILVATVHAQDAILDGFDPNNIGYQNINADISYSADLKYVLEDRDIMAQQQQPHSHRKHDSHNQAQFTYPNRIGDARSQDSCSADIARIFQPGQKWPTGSHPPQTPLGVLQRSYASLQPVHLSHAPAQTPWLQHDSVPQGRHTQDITQQQYATHQYTMSLLSETASTEPLGGLYYHSLGVYSALPSSVMATKMKVFKKSSGDRTQKEPAATRKAQSPAQAQVSAQTTQPVAAAVPSAMGFESFAEAKQAAVTRVILHNYTPPVNDSSLPKDDDDATRKVYIRQMYDAYVDITQCIDRATVANFDSHFTTLSSHSPTSPITPVMISTICWHLLTIAIDLHTRGPVSLNIYDPAKLKNVYTHRNLTFKARIDAVCELLKLSKARCASLLKHDGLEMVVANAPMLCRQTKTNHSSNGHRQDYLATGNDAVAGKKRDASEMDSDEAKKTDADESDEW